MSQPYICATCRLRPLLSLRPALTAQRRQWLSQTSRVRQDGQTRTRPQQEEKVGRYSRQTLQPHQVLDQLDGPPEQSRDSSANARKRPASVRSERRDGSIDRINLSQALSGKRHAFIETGKTPPNDAAAWVALQNILKGQHDPQELETLGKERTFSRACYFWMQRIWRAWDEEMKGRGRGLNTPHGADLPWPVLALKVLSTVSPGNRSLYPEVLWNVVTTLVDLHLLNSATNSHASRQAFRDGLQQLMGIWSVSMAVQLKRQQPAEQAYPRSILFAATSPAPVDWSFLPAQEAFVEYVKTLQEKENVHLSLASIMKLLLPLAPDLRRLQAEMAETHHRNDYASAALVTMDLLELARAQPGGETFVEPFQPWRDLMSATLKHAKGSHESKRGLAKVPPALAQKTKFTEDGAVRAYYRGVIERAGLGSGQQTRHFESDKAHGADLKAAPDEAATFTPSTTEPPPPAPTNVKKPSTMDAFVTNCVTRLGRAAERDGLVAAEAVLKDVHAFTARNTATQLPPALYEHLMFTFLSLRSFRNTVDVWNEMLKAGHVPSCKTYTVMMRGCSQVRDFGAMEGFWRKMREAKVMPDCNAWSVRIHGLLRQKKLDASLPVLREMGQEWVSAARADYHAKNQPAAAGKKAEKPLPEVSLQMLLSQYPGDNVDGVPKPDVVVMNSAVSALASSDDTLIPKVLSWGRSFGIEPNTLTYNALINLSMRHGNPDEALALLETMKERGIKANQKTWTVLLTAMFETDWLRNLDGEAQKDKVLAFIESLESMPGSKIEQESYALIIDRLLKKYNNPTAASVILAKMAEKGIQPNTHIYTILMTSYFSQDPPHFAAIDALWSRIQSAESGYGAPLDTIFFDRMVESYAQHHRTLGTTAPMLSFLSLMQEQGKRPSWRALDAAARALAEAGEWENLIRIVGEVRRRIEKEGTESRGFGQKDFWRFIIETGILRDEGITRVEQVWLGREEDARQKFGSGGTARR